ncbi:MAG: acyl-CoA dehydrogenase family protein [Dehalococcoidia bacterium]|nr:acyl-CoA dehydrogenase family protein [Dehalococcoidia bacterium]MCA9856582.1 acyl-CoA dehydrogenase family protein [Dehalococcoidia bacterium]MCB9483053.1 acyl-CoA dehydrogenase family protein [Dehalococcoidia bacterium]MCB9490845.1 acyl-CoA dehydrogenase family protein [Dehalococcoidia bacterium]
MDWSDSPEQAEFRKEVRDFIQKELPQAYRSGEDGGEGFEGGWQADRKSEDPKRRETAMQWADALSKKGWIAPAWPKEYGGAGLTTIEQFIYNQEMAEVAAPMPGGMGVSMIGPTMIVHGTDEQKAEHLPKILSGEVAWAQGYSEPGAGSDLASLQTRAVRDGDEYVVNGQKIWTSGGHQADWLFALVRTDPEAPKHRGISFLVMDIKSPGLSLRPLINMGWKHHFNETFFEDVRVPVKNRIGEENRGWYVGMTLLDFERSGIAGAISYKRSLDQVKKFLDSNEGKQFRRQDFDAVRLEMADRAIETQILFNFAFRIVSIQNRGLVPNYEASVNKMYGAELHQRLSRTETKAWGLYGNVWDPKSKYAPMKAEHVQDYVGSVPHTIFSGSNEIQRNVIATRGLGLPRG